MKKRRDDPSAIMVSGLESLVTWMPLLIVATVLGLAGTVTFAMLWWLG